MHVAQLAKVLVLLFVSNLTQALPTPGDVLSHNAEANAAPIAISSPASLSTSWRRSENGGAFPGIPPDWRKRDPSATGVRVDFLTKRSEAEESAEAGVVPPPWRREDSDSAAAAEEDEKEIPGVPPAW